MIEYIVYGGDIKVKDVKGIIKNGYNHTENKISDYELDPHLSGQRVQVYKNDKTKQIVVNHTWTNSKADVLTDIGLVLGNNKSNKRFQQSKKITNDAKNKYRNDYKYVHIGHSLGYQLARESADHDNQVIGLNGATTQYDLLTPQGKNETMIKSTLDPVSMLHDLKPFKNTKKNYQH